MLRAVAAGFMRRPRLHSQGREKKAPWARKNRKNWSTANSSSQVERLEDRNAPGSILTHSGAGVCRCISEGHDASTSAGTRLLAWEEPAGRKQVRWALLNGGAGRAGPRDSCWRRWTISGGQADGSQAGGRAGFPSGHGRRPEQARQQLPLKPIRRCRRSARSNDPLRLFLGDLVSQCGTRINDAVGRFFCRRAGARLAPGGVSGWRRALLPASRKRRRRRGK